MVPVASTAPRKKRHFLALFSTLFLFWMLLSASLALDVLITGVAVAALISLLFQQGLSFFAELHLSRKALQAGFQYFGYFFIQLVRSNLRMAAIVLSPSLPIQPAIVRVKTKLKSRLGRLMLANSISLTPGTLTIQLTDDYLYIHCVTLDVNNIDAETREIISGFETYLEVMYG